jgi:hypothetical protein
MDAKINRPSPTVMPKMADVLSDYFVSGHPRGQANADGENCDDHDLERRHARHCRGGG